VDNELVAKIRNHPKYNESVHSALIEVIEREYNPEQLRVMLAAPLLDSLIGGMLASMLSSQGDDDDSETAVHKYHLQQAEELMRKSWGFLNSRAQNTQDSRVKIKTE
jgi:hypothetical protein